MRRTPILGGLGALAVVGGGFSAALLHFSRKWIVPPRVMLDLPGCESVEEAHFAAEDGTSLYGWFLRAGEDRRALILCHGYQRSMEETFALGCQLRERGFNVLVFDFRGCGRSDGPYTTLGYREPEDARAAIDWIRARTGAGRVGLLGISMGGAVALTAAAGREDVAAVVADSAFATLEGAVGQRLAGLRFPMLTLYRLTMRAAERLCGGRVADVRPVDAAARITQPVLLIHGTDDDIVPYEHARDLDAALAAAHELWTVAGAGHTEARFRAPAEYLNRVGAFFDCHLGPSRSAP